MRGLGALILIGLLLAVGGAGVADAAGPLTFVTSIPLGSRAHDLVIVGDLAYVATDAGLTIVDLSDPAVPVERGSVPTGSSARVQGIAVNGSHAYLAGQTAGVHVVDISDPDAPEIVATKRVAGSVWDVAVKGTYVYAVTFHGELYVIDVSVPANPLQIKVLGLLAWSNAKHDAIQLPKLNAHVAAGGAKATGVSVTGDILLATDWNYGRLYYYDVSNPASPRFSGTHYVPFVLRAEADPARDAVYMLAAYGRWSGIHTVPLSALAPTHSTRYDQCADCRFLKSLGNIDQGGLGLSPTGNHLFYGGGRVREFHVVGVSDGAPGDPVELQDLAFADTGSHGLRLAEIMGFASLGNHIYVAAGAQGLQVYSFLGASD